MKFSGFIITYNRPKELLETIQKVFAQSYPPESLWIIDNSSDDQTEKEMNSFQTKKIKYHRIGYNAGPAGAAVKGLELCVADGADWVYWGDDDDPPPFTDTFEQLFNLIDEIDDVSKIAQVGLVGTQFNNLKGEFRRLTDRELKEKKIVEVDSIAGNQSKIINKTVIQLGAIPCKNLFFGFEELDFDLKLKELGFKSYINGALNFELRKKYKKDNFKADIIRKRKIENLWRQYYSTRNLLFILQRNRFYSALNYQILKMIIRAIFSFKFGLNYGMKTSRFTFYGILDFFKGIKGQFLQK